MPRMSLDAHTEAGLSRERVRLEISTNPHDFQSEAKTDLRKGAG